MNDIQTIYDMLHWNSRFGDQLKGIELAKQIEDLSLLIPSFASGENKTIWDNCARALYELSDERLEPYLPGLLEWLVDLNWPGADIIRDRLIIFSGEKLKKPFIDRFTYVKNLNNGEGMRWLDNLSELLDNEELKLQLPKPVVEVLQKHRDEPGFW